MYVFVQESSSTCKGGAGIFSRGDYLCASVVGRLVEHKASSDTEQGTIVDIQRPQASTPVVYPCIGDLVICKVVKVSLRQAFVDIIQIQGQDVVETFSALIRSSDIRSSDIDAVEIHRCFKPRDIVKARVLSLGDQRAYYLTTAEPELGVVSCRSNTTGSLLVPLDEKTVICEKTQEKEERKACVAA